MLDIIYIMASEEECKECDKIFAKIKEIDRLVTQYYNEKRYYEWRLEYIRFAGVHPDSLRVVQILYNESWENWMIAKNKQIKRHKKLTKHFREVHLI